MIFQTIYVQSKVGNERGSNSISTTRKIFYNQIFSSKVLSNICKIILFFLSLKQNTLYKREYLRKGKDGKGTKDLFCMRNEFFKKSNAKIFAKKIRHLVIPHFFTQFCVKKKQGKNAAITMHFRNNVIFCICNFCL